MQEVVLVRIREGEKIAYFSIKDLLVPPGIRHIFRTGTKSAEGAAGEPAYLKKVKIGDYVIIEAERGREYGQVISEPELVAEEEIEAPLLKVIRIVTRDDLRQIQENKKKTKEAMSICEKKIVEHKLDMKPVDAEYSFDRSKFVFYFTAEGRIDFRELVKDLAREFRARIELRQIGVRDEAKMFGGYGPCGRVLCCKSFLKDFEPVTVRMAKDQNLPLNPSKISGVCGRLMCCLGYEYRVYKQFLQGLPKQGETINTKEGKARVISVNPLKRTVVVEVGEEGKQIEVAYPGK
ncbi:MAG: stage 0 sporulation family protein [Candidatus Omnitrophica bacterium]|nr:stage 0 sporulation family protein [Candidatus Omnitrophota bacterium]